MPRTRDVDVDMDAVLAEVGHFGCYQLHLFLLVVFPVLFSACASSQYIFSAAELNYRCFVPECEERPGKWKPGTWAEWALISGSSCTRRKPLNGTCDKAAFSSSIQKCDAWVYESNDTIVAEFNLACKDWKRTMVGTMHSVGVFTAYTFIGIASDKFGRCKIFIIAVVSGATMGVIRSFANSYIFYVAFEYFDAVFGGGIYGTGFVLVIEMVGKHRRVLCGSALGGIFASGLILLAGCILSNFVLDRFGRKYTLMSAYLICGLLLFLLPFIPKKWNLIPTLLAKSFISLAFVSIYIFTMELFPTNARHSLMALCSLIGRIGSITAPSTPLLLKIKFWLPYVIFAVLACIAAMLLAFVPETLRKPMPETISQAENIRFTPTTPIVKKDVKISDPSSQAPESVSSSVDSPSVPTTSAFVTSSPES
ncbi:hypothetical protein O0L34_g18208 [Tuta absoluta]|nr:hypothetical protein O0L34_g18208 [Tuta absoluta]